MTEYKHFLFATDMSEACSKVVEKAKKFSAVFGAKLSVVNFVEPVTM
ncbi:universal stress protein, partial [Piscirickettsia litoralis]